MIGDGAALQRDRLIVAVGPDAELARRFDPDETVGSADEVVIPGLVDAHHHVGVTPLQQRPRDHALAVWFATRLARPAVDPRLDTLSSAFDLIASGVTSVVGMVRAKAHGVRSGRSARGIVPHVRRFYEGWLDGVSG